MLQNLTEFREFDHRRTGQHPFGGGRPSFARMDSGGGGSSRNFPRSIFSGGVVAEIFRHPYSVGWQNFFRYLQ